MAELPPDAVRRERFRTIYEENYKRLLGYALRRTAPDDAADAVAETFIVAWRRLEELPEGEATRLWLYGTARRVLANQTRSQRRQARLSDRVRTDLARDLADMTLSPEPTDAAVALARLRPDEREILRLSAWEGLDPGEIAAIFGWSRNAARIRLHRARRRLKRELARLEGGSDEDTAAHNVAEASDTRGVARRSRLVPPERSRTALIEREEIL